MADSASSRALSDAKRVRCFRRKRRSPFRASKKPVQGVEEPSIEPTLLLVALSVGRDDCARETFDDGALLLARLGPESIELRSLRLQILFGLLLEIEDLSGHEGCHRAVLLKKREFRVGALSLHVFLLRRDQFFAGVFVHLLAPVDDLLKTATFLFQLGRLAVQGLDGKVAHVADVSRRLLDPAGHAPVGIKFQFFVKLSLCVCLFDSVLELLDEFDAALAYRRGVDESEKGRGDALDGVGTDALLKLLEPAVDMRTCSARREQLVGEVRKLLADGDAVELREKFILLGLSESGHAMLAAEAVGRPDAQEGRELLL